MSSENATPTAREESSGREPVASASATGALSRRGLFGAGAAGVALAAGGGAVGYAVAPVVEISPVGSDAVPFWGGENGGHQAGITTPAQDRLHFVAFDVITDDRARLVELLKSWTAAAARMTQGSEASEVSTGETQPEIPPGDTGEALDLPPSQLTITVGFGPSLFDDRFGVRERRPEALADLPSFPQDSLKPEISGGDICVQACSNDPQVAVHAIRNLTRLGMGVVQVRYSQLGFGRTSATSTAQTTPRNLMGFKDGTNNLKLEERDLVNEHVWVDEGPEWIHGGSYMVTRRIRMFIELWDSTNLAEQQNIFARHKVSGAPLTGGDDPAKEHSTLEFDAYGADGKKVIPVDSHVRLAHPDHNGGARLLRRGYNFVDGSDGLGTLDAGLFFIAYQADPRRQFVPVQQNLARSDGLNEYIKHVGSGLWACPPGPATGSYWGEALFT
jgi:deferrochelatase/peroxidase EfeB